MEHRLLVPRPGIEPSLSLLEVWMLNHWTSREIPLFCFLLPTLCNGSWTMSKVYELLSSQDRPGTCRFAFFSAFRSVIGTAFLQMIFFKPSSLHSQVSHTSCKLHQLTFLGSKCSQILSSSLILWILTTIWGHFLLASCIIDMWNSPLNIISERSLIALALLDYDSHQGKICWLTHLCISRPW